MKKIVFFIGFYPDIVGGAEYQSKILAQKFIEDGFEVTYISFPHKIEKIIYKENIKIYMLNFKYRIFHKITLYYFFFKKIKKILLIEKPDYIYQRILNSFSYYISNYSRNRKVKYVLHVSDNYSLIFKGFTISSIVRRLFFKKIIYNNPFIILQTLEQKKLLNNELIKINKNKHYKKVLVVPNINSIYFSNCENIILRKNERKYILWVGNIRPVKNLELFLKISNIFYKSPYEFHVIGDIFGKRYKNKINRIIKKSNIIYHGLKSNDFVNLYLKNSLILVNTSYSEGLSNTYIQAWSNGTPVVSFNSNPNNYFKNKQLGIYCSMDENVLIDAINYYLNIDDKVFYNNVLFCTKFSKEHFSNQIIFNKLINFINED